MVKREAKLLGQSEKDEEAQVKIGTRQSSPHPTHPPPWGNKRKRAANTLKKWQDGIGLKYLEWTWYSHPWEQKLWCFTNQGVSANWLNEIFCRRESGEQNQISNSAGSDCSELLSSLSLYRPTESLPPSGSWSTLEEFLVLHYLQTHRLIKMTVRKLLSDEETEGLVSLCDTWK